MPLADAVERGRRASLWSRGFSDRESRKPVGAVGEGPTPSVGHPVRKRAERRHGERPKMAADACADQLLTQSNGGMAQGLALRS